MKNEKRLIYANSAQMVVEYMEKHLVVGDSDFLQGYIAGIKGLADGLAELPSVDAVEVVRCCDCIHCNPVQLSSDSEVLCNCTHQGRPVIVDPADFCSYGERKAE